jgi:ubiquinone/menaquinone biosynthesis C-methylase UbiE
VNSLKDNLNNKYLLLLDTTLTDQLPDEQSWKHGDRFVEDYMAQNYDFVYNSTRFANAMYKDFSDEIIKIVSKKSKIYTSKILELGCGTGIISLLLSKYDKVNNIQRYCMDFSFNMVKIAKKRCSYCIQSDMESIPFRGDSFDIVYVHSAIHHFPHFKDILIEAKRILKPNGLLIIQEPPQSNIKKDFVLRSLAFFFRKIGTTQYKDVSHLELNPSDHHAPISFDLLISEMKHADFIIENKKFKYYASKILSGFDSYIAYKIGRVLDRYYVEKYNDGYMLLIIGRKKK